jgi:hypothetical protein
MTERETRINDMNESKLDLFPEKTLFYRWTVTPRSLSRNVTDSVTSHRLCHVTIFHTLNLSSHPQREDCLLFSVNS